MRDIHGNWLPDLFPKQLDVFNSRAHILLVEGPRASGKTRAVLNRLCRHLWDLDRARILMFSRTQKSAKDGGTWSLMHRDIIPEWIKADFGFRYTTDTAGIPGPKRDGNTRSEFFKVTNRHGSESEMWLFSLDNDDDIEAKIKNLEASCFYFSELDNFGDRRALTVPLAGLRIGRFEDQLWIADCNPSEEGEASWIFQCFMKERLLSLDDFNASQRQQELPEYTEQDFKDFYGNMDVITILPSDNPYVDRRTLQAIKGACGADAGLYARHVEGKWIWGGGDSSRHFRTFLKPHHILGSIQGSEEEWETIVPSPDCSELVLGFDLGETNHSGHIIEKTNPQTPLTQAMRMPLPYFSVIDELISLNKDVSHEEYAQAFLAMIQRLEQLAGYQYNLDRSYSDKSAIEKYSSVADTYPYLLVKSATEDRIVLIGVPKAAGSVRARVRLIKQLLSQDRLRVSAHCTQTIQMLRDLKKGKEEINFIDKRDRHKHAFDSLSYAILMECADELRNDLNTPNTVKRSLGHVQIG